jgi:predicted lactoylglutathione lyase
LIGIDAQRVDFIVVPVRDRERAVQFYGATLGLEKNPGAIFTDPDGNGLIIHRRYAPYADGTKP